MILKGLSELGINKNLIGNEYLLPKLTRFGDEVAESDECSEEEMASQDAINDESESEDYSEEETQDSKESSERQGIHLVTVRKRTCHCRRWAVLRF